MLVKSTEATLILKVFSVKNTDETKTTVRLDREDRRSKNTVTRPH